MVDFMRYKKWWFGISGVLLIPGIVGLLVFHLKPGIDFTGGSQAEYAITKPADVTAIKNAYQAAGVNDATYLQTTQNQTESLLVQSESLSDQTHKTIIQKVQAADSKITELSFDSVSGAVGQDTTRRAIEAIIIASAVIIVFIAWSFRSVPKPASSWQFGIFAVVALLHDLLFILGSYSLLGHFLHYQVTADFITAILTVMGFSVHDTIVVFDRLRENLKRYPHLTFTQTVNVSLSQTIARSINTSLTVLFTLLAVTLLGGVTIRSFTVTLLLGIATGTYSSIFVATPLLDLWHNWSARRHHRPQRIKRSR